MNSFDYIAWLRGSLDNSKDGASGKKMAAFWVVMCLATPSVLAWAVWAFLHNDWSLLPTVLSSVFTFAGSALLLNGAEKTIAQFKTTKNETPVDNSAGPGTVQLPDNK